MTEQQRITGPAWAVGLATTTVPEGKVLDTLYLEPRLGLDDAPENASGRDAPAEDRRGHRPRRRRLRRRDGPDELRGVTVVPVLTVIEDLAAPPADTHDAYLRLHLLSHRLVAPNTINLDGIFGVLPNVAWTNRGPVDPADLPSVRLRARALDRPLSVTSVDKFPQMTDYVAPGGVRIADARRVRLGAHLAEGTTVMHEGFVNFNAGTLGASMVEGRISQGVVVGDGSDIGGGASIMGTLERRRQGHHLGRQRLPDRRQRRPRHLARRRLHRRGRPLPHRRHARDDAGGRDRQGARALRARTTCSSAATR